MPFSVLLACSILCFSTLFKASNTDSSELLLSCLLFSFSGYCFLINKKSYITLSATIVTLITFQYWLAFQYLAGVSHDSYHAEQSLLYGIALLCFVIAITNHQQNHSIIKSLVFTFIGLACAQSLYGSFMVLSGIEHILWWPKEYYVGKATGTFVNPNHFCAFLNIGVILLLATHLSTNTQRGDKTSKWTQITHFIYSPNAICLFILLLGIALSRSFGGLLNLLASVTTLIFIKLLVEKRSIPFNRYILLALPITILAFSGVDSNLVLGELNALSDSLQQRLDISSSAYSAAKDHGLIGTGAGSFYTIFPSYRTPEVGSAFYYHAHNDYLEFLTEFGLVGVIFGALFIIFALKDNYAIAINSTNTYEMAIAYTSIAITAGLAVHSVIDFPLQTRAVSMAFVVILSLNCQNRLSLIPKRKNKESL